MRKTNYFPDGWRVDKSQDYCAKVADGTHDTPKSVNDGKKLVTSKNIKEGRVNFDDCYFISENDFININRRSKVDRGDVLFSMIGTVGEIALVKEDPDYAIKNIGLFKPKSFMDGVWLYYYLTSQIGQSALDTFLTGTSQQFVSLGDLRKVPIVSPPDAIKKRISAILSTYDDLIEINNRRIAILEKMAEELYREWFVRLRFPGHEKVKIVKGVPEGWRIGCVGDLGRVVTGKTPPTSNRAYFDGQYPFVKTPDMHDNLFVVKTEETLAEDGIRYQKAQTLPENSICVSCIGTGGVVAITSVVSQTNQQINSVILKQDYYREWAFFTFKGLKELIYLFGYTGATMTNLSKGKFENLKFIMPSHNIIEGYHNKTKGIFNLIQNLQKQTFRLSEFRDRLLSRLLSGKIDVENMDIQFPASMQEELAHA
ncbi:MAG: restriction endonuclease subunit S [Planctomycetota bacterium]